MPATTPNPACPPSDCTGVFSGVILRSPFAATLLNARSILPYPSDEQAHRLDTVMGWGLKPGAERARQFAERYGLRFLRAEDAFLRSVKLGVQGEGPIGICLDDQGMYYDARSPSRLESLIHGADSQPSDAAARAERCIEQVRIHGLSKYNWWQSEQVPWRDDRPRVLVVDQTAGDLSISRGLASAGSFERMLDDALEAHPDAEVVVKVHPDVLSGHKHGHLEHVGGESRVRLLSEPVNPIRLLERIDEVYVVTSQLGFEALLLGKSVHCYGMPFYAGWGLTQDALRCDRRGKTRTLAQLFHAAYMEYARYAQPERGTECQVEDVIDHLAWQRAAFARNAGSHVLIGMPWKMRRAHRVVVAGPQSEVSHSHGCDRNPTTPLVWTPSSEAVARGFLEPQERTARLIGPGPLDTLLPARGPLPASFAYSGPPADPGFGDQEHATRGDDRDDEARRALRLLREWAAGVPAQRPGSRSPFVLFLGSLDAPPARPGIEGDLAALTSLNRGGLPLVYARPAGRRLSLLSRRSLSRLGARVISTDAHLPGWIRSASHVHTRDALSGIWLGLMVRELCSDGSPWLPPLTAESDEQLTALLTRLLVAGPCYASFRTGYPCSCGTAIAERLAFTDTSRSSSE